MSTVYLPGNPLVGGGINQLSTEKAPASPSCCETVRTCFHNLGNCIAQSCLGRCYKCIKPYGPLLSTGFTAIMNGLNSRPFHLFLRLGASYLASSGGDTDKHYRFLVLLIKALELFAGVAIPFALYTIVTQGYAIFTGPDKLDAFLKMTEGVAWAGESVTTFADGLFMIGALENAVAFWAIPLSVVSGFLAIATCVLNTKSLIEGRKFLKEFEEALELKQEKNISVEEQFNSENKINYQNGWSLLQKKSDYDLLKHIGIPGKKCRPLLEKIKERAQEAISTGKNEEGEKIQKTFFQSLITRIKAKNFSAKLAITMSVITVIATICLLFPLLLPAGYTLLTLSALVFIWRFFYEHRSLLRIQKEWELLANPAPVDQNAQPHLTEATSS